MNVDWDTSFSASSVRKDREVFAFVVEKKEKTTKKKNKYEYLNSGKKKKASKVF